MKPLHKVIMVSATFLLAAATGHVMQNPDSFGMNGPPALPQPDQTVADGAPVPAVTEPDGRSIQVSGQQIEGEAMLPPTPAALSPSSDSGVGPLAGLDEPASSGFATSCAGASFDQRVAPGGAVVLRIDARCAAGRQLMIRHEGLELPVTLGATGGWSGVVPALATDARYSVVLPDGGTLETQAAIAGVDGVNRVILSWTGDLPLQMDAYEAGAEPGGPGHVSTASPRSVDTALGGWMTRFDDAATGQHVQIYSAPANLTDTRFDISAEVTPQSCARNVSAQVRRILSGKSEEPVEVSLALPDCDGVLGMVVMPLPDLPAPVAAN